MKWMLGPDFEMTLRDLAKLKSSLDGNSLDRLIQGIPADASTTLRSSLDIAPPDETDSMPYDSESDPDLTRRIFSTRTNKGTPQ